MPLLDQQLRNLGQAHFYVTLYPHLHCCCNIPGNLRLFLPYHLYLDGLLGHRTQRDCPDFPWLAGNNDE